MTSEALQTRSQKAEHLRVFQTSDDSFYVESEDRRIAYHVLMSTDKHLCTCPDFVNRSKSDPAFTCKHILATAACKGDGDAVKVAFLSRVRPKLDERFICEIDGREFVKYPGLLDLGHQKGIHRIEVTILQLPSAENSNSAICRAEVESTQGELFSDIGDASPMNCSAKVAKHFLRLASTRSIARALRSFTNIGMTCLEELGGDDDIIAGDGTKQKPRLVKRPQNAGKVQPIKSDGKKQDAPKAQVPAPTEQKVQEPVIQQPSEDTKEVTVPTDEQKPSEQPSSGSSSTKMSEAQKRALFSLARRRGLSADDVDNMAMETYHCKAESLTSYDAASLIRQLQQSA